MMSDVIASLQRDHAEITKLLGMLESEILAIEVGKTPNYPLMQDIMQYLGEYSDHLHHPKEDLIFTQLLRYDPKFRNDIDDLIEDHVLIARAGNEFAQLLRSTDADSVDVREHLGACGFNYIRTQREHMSKEDNHLFPLAAALLSASDWQVIEDAASNIDRELAPDSNK
jgi:hemerythrin-like domain-containing protein